MNELTNKLLKEFIPKMAIVVFEGSDHGYYLESHPVLTDGSFGEGRPLKHDTIKKMVGVFHAQQKEEARIGGLMPECLFYQSTQGDSYKLAWYRPAQRRKMHFAANLKIDSAEAWVPPMIYVATNSSLRVFAMDTNWRPTEKTELFHAPFHNVNANGDVCLGSAKVEKVIVKTYQNQIDYWEKMFWQSEFTHLNNRTPTKTNVNLLWMRLVAEPNLTWADLDELVPSTSYKTLQTLLPI